MIMMMILHVVMRLFGVYENTYTRSGFDSQFRGDAHPFPTSDHKNIPLDANQENTAE